MVAVDERTEAIVAKKSASQNQRSLPLNVAFWARPMTAATVSRGSTRLRASIGQAIAGPSPNDGARHDPQLRSTRKPRPRTVRAGSIESGWSGSRPMAKASRTRSARAAPADGFGREAVQGDHAAIATPQDQHGRPDDGSGRTAATPLPEGMATRRAPADRPPMDTRPRRRVPPVSTSVTVAITYSPGRRRADVDSGGGVSGRRGPFGLHLVVDPAIGLLEAVRRLTAGSQPRAWRILALSLFRPFTPFGASSL